MKRLKTFTASLVILAAATLGAQTPNPLPVTGNLSSIIGAGLPYAGVSIQLQNCASPVSITGYSVIVQQGYQVRASSSGVVNTTVWPNDLIDCNGTTGNSQYMLSYVAGGAVQGTPQCYQVVSTQTVWNLNAQQPISCSQSPPNPQDGQFNNLNVTGFFTALGGNIQANSLEAKTTGIPRPVYDVTQYGAVGNGIADDGPAIQAAFNACWNSGIPPYGGSVLFPGGYNFTFKENIYAYDACKITGAGTAGAAGVSNPVFISYSGTAQPAPVTITSFTIQTNSTLYPAYSPAPTNIYGTSATMTATPAFATSNSGGAGTTFTTSAVTGTISAGEVAIGANIPTGDLVTGISGSSPNFTVTLASTTTGAVSGTVNFQYASGQWGIFQGFSTTVGGLQLDNVVTQIMGTPTGSGFTVPLQNGGTVGTYTTDSGTFTPIDVGIATDAKGRYQELIQDVMLKDASGTTAAQQMGVSLFMGSRVDSGTRCFNSWIDGGLYSDMYFSQGGIDYAWNNGCRSDGTAILGNVYWRIGGQDSLGISDESLSGGTNNVNLYGTTHAFPTIVLDNTGCAAGASVRVNLFNSRHEIDDVMAPGTGSILGMACPTSRSPQFFITGVGDYTACGANAAAYSNCPSIAIVPAGMDNALVLSLHNSVAIAGSGSAHFPAWQGINRMNRGYMASASGFINSLTYSPEDVAGAFTPGNESVNQAIGDLNFFQLYQDGIPASALMLTGPAFSALPAGQNLYAGQVLAPPVYWNAGSAVNRFALDSVYQTGTVGNTPNNGNDNCTTTATGSQYSCTGPQATVSATSCSSNLLTFTTGAWSSPYASTGPPIGSIITAYQTAESLFNGPNGWGAPFLPVTASNSSSVTVPFLCSTFTGNASDTGFVTISPANDLSSGQYVILSPTPSREIQYIDAVNPLAVLVNVLGSVTTQNTPTQLTWTAPLTGLEIQLPTKTAAVPTAQEPYQQGDVLWNSAAASGVTPGWQNSTAIGSYTPVLSTGTIASVTVNNGGGPFPDTPACLFIGGGGTGATCTATVSANVVTAINVTAAGSGYLSTPQVVLKTKGTWLPFGLVSSVATSLNLNNVTESSNYTLTGSEGAVNIDNSGGPYTITLPASPAASGPVTIFPYNGTTNIAAGVGATLINIPSALTTLAPITVYYDGSSTWKCYSGACTTSGTFSAPVTSATGGTNTGTVTCLTAACTNISGTYSVVGGTFTTGNMLVLVWPTTTAVYRCWASQNGGVATYGIGHSVATATGMTITNGVSVTGVTVTIDYGCSQY